MTNKAPLTIQDLLIQAQQRHYELGRGSFNVAYRLDSVMPELSDYVLRVRKYPCFDHQGWQETSSLTPPTNFMSGMRLGQPLLELHDPNRLTTLLDIVRREPGRSIDQWQRQAQREAGTAAWLNAATEVMENVLRPCQGINDNPFFSIMEQCYRLRCHGFRPDIAAGNIMMQEDGTLSLIDQLQYDRPNTDFFGHRLALQEVRENLFTIFCTPSDAIKTQLKRPDLPEGLRQRYLDASDQIEAMLGAAYDYTLAHYKDRENPANPFTKVEQTSGIALDAPPKQLVEALRRMEARIGAKEAVLA